jgi:hypothetical protein
MSEYPRTETLTQPRPRPHRGKSKKRRNFDQYTINFFARVLRFLAGDRDRWKGTWEELHKMGHFATGVISPATTEMEKRGWLRKEQDLHKPRGEDRAVTYHLTQSFPIPPNAFTRQARRFIEDIVVWSGGITSSDMCLLWGFACLANKHRQYSYSGDPKELAELTLFNVHDIHVNRIRRLVERKRLKLISRSRKPAVVQLQLADHSGRIEGQPWPKNEIEVADGIRHRLYQFVESHSGEDLRVRRVMNDLDCSEKQLRGALYWLVEHKHISSDQKEIGGPNCYFPLRPYGAAPATKPTAKRSARLLEFPRRAK